jgi:hypothetical protein
VRLINDFEAVAWALPYPSVASLALVKDSQHLPDLVILKRILNASFASLACGNVPDPVSRETGRLDAAS